MAAIGVDKDVRARHAGLANVLLVGLAHLDPEVDRAGKVPLPEVGFVGIADLVAEEQRVAGVERKGQQPDHHALVCLRRMAGEGDAVVVDSSCGSCRRSTGPLEYGRFKGHRVMAEK